MIGFDPNDLPENLTIGEITAYLSLAGSLTEVTVGHGMTHFSDPEHECQPETDYSDAPEFTDVDVRAFLAYEDASLQTLKWIRELLRQQGYPLTEHVTEESA